MNKDMPLSKSSIKNKLNITFSLSFHSLFKIQLMAKMFVFLRMDKLDLEKHIHFWDLTKREGQENSFTKKEELPQEVFSIFSNKSSIIKGLNGTSRFSFRFKKFILRIFMISSKELKQLKTKQLKLK